jgi:hypothetical protein
MKLIQTDRHPSVLPLKKEFSSVDVRESLEKERTFPKATT